MEQLHSLILLVEAASQARLHAAQGAAVAATGMLAA
jgi:hypothetical protein